MYPPAFVSSGQGSQWAKSQIRSEYDCYKKAEHYR